LNTNRPRANCLPPSGTSPLNNMVGAMDKKIVWLVAVLVLALGCTMPGTSRVGSSPGSVAPAPMVFDPIDPAALPDVQDLPKSVTFNKPKLSRRYIGIIKNTTGYDLVVPSDNSSAALPLPAKGYIEYVAWQKNFDLTVYRNGKPFYCLKIEAHPKDYPYMCSRYDFLAEVVGPKPLKKSKLKKRRLKKKIKSESYG
jgi:hypothetical protein